MTRSDAATAGPLPAWNWRDALLLAGLAGLVAGTVLAVVGVVVGGAVLIGAVVLAAALAVLAVAGIVRLLRD